MLEKYIAFFESHERLLIVLAVMLLGVYGWNHYVDKSSENAKIQAALSAQIAQSAKDQDAKNAAYVAQIQASFNQQQALRDQEIASLVAAIAQRDAVTKQKVTGVLTPGLPTSTIVNDLSFAYAPFDVSPVQELAEGWLGFRPEVVQHFTAAKIEGDAAKANFTDSQKHVTELQESYDSLTSVNAGLITRIDGLTTLIAKNDKACEDEKKSLKDDARKSKWKTFWWGFAAGFGVRQMIKP